MLLALVPSVSAGVRLLASTLLVMGGNTNPEGLTPLMQQQLGGDPYYPNPYPDPFKPVGTFGDGYIDTQNNPDSPYFGWTFQLVPWPAQISLPINGNSTYEQSQQQGVHNIDWDISTTLPTLVPGEKLVAFGYSSSANVMVREMRALQNQPGGAPATDQLGFILMGNPNRPNGGIMQRFPGLYIPLVDIRFDGSNPTDTPYQTTDISWQYDVVADFPNYPINLLADLNSLVAGSLLHGNYYPADMNGPRAIPDTTIGKITYVTLKPPHLPLLMPLYTIGFPKPLLDLVEPALTVMVDWGYDRSISPGTPRTAQLIPRVNPFTAVRDLADSIGEGIHDFVNDLHPAPSIAPAAAALTAAGAQTQTTRQPTHDLSPEPAEPSIAPAAPAAATTAPVDAGTSAKRQPTHDPSHDVSPEPAERSLASVGGTSAPAEAGTASTRQAMHDVSAAGDSPSAPSGSPGVEGAHPDSGADSGTSTSGAAAA